MRKSLLLWIVYAAALLRCEVAGAQWTYGTSGLLNMPSAEMEENGSFMIGNSYLNKHTSTSRWFYDTFGYYFNITLFSFVEVGYNLELHKAVPDDYGTRHPGTHYWVPDTYGKFVNQDRQICMKMRLWKEGWVSEWTPQIVVGADDISSHTWGEVDKQFAVEDDMGNSFNNRYFVAATKHFHIPEVGEIGAHVAWLYNVRSDYSLNAPSFGVNLRLFKEKVWYNPNLVDDFRWLMGQEIQEEEDPKSEAVLPTWKRWLSGFNFKMELYPANGQGYIYDNSYTKLYGLDRGVHLGIYDVNIGFEYELPLTKNRTRAGNPATSLALQTELYGCRHFSAGLQLKVHLL